MKKSEANFSWGTIYRVHRDVDPQVEKCAREEVESAQCASCGRPLPPELWDRVRPRIP